MLDVYSQLVSWFASTEKDQWSDQLAQIIRSCEISLTPVWHPLGFIHVKLAQSDLNDTFRMHLWSSKYRNAQEQHDKIHDHLFQVRSRVVFGGIKDVRYQFHHNVCGNQKEIRILYGPKHVSFEDVNVYGDVKETSSNFLNAPSEYVIPALELHETSLFDSEIALTVVHTTEPVHYQPRAIFARDTRLPLVRTPLACDKSLWRNLMQQMLPL